MEQIKKEKLVSGITATGTLTIGNYIGAIKSFVKLQYKYDMYIFIADLHALTVDIKPEVLRKNSRNIFALYLAAGLDPNIVTLFYQSDVKEHSELSWILSTKTTIGELNRMTQFKDKSQKTRTKNKTDSIPTGLLIYPVLMAADILLYNPTIVPTGVDQKQHIELTRNLANRFNNKYGKTFEIPDAFIPTIGSKIMSLVDPTKKMSKSSDNPNVAANKIRKAVTDSENKVYISQDKLGILNLITIYASLKDITLVETEAKFINHNYKDFKDEVAQTVKLFLEEIQIKYKKSLEIIDQIAIKGARKAQLVATKNLDKIKRRIGLK